MVHAPGVQIDELSQQQAGTGLTRTGAQGFAPPPELTMARIKSSVRDLQNAAGGTLAPDLRADLEAVRDSLNSACAANDGLFTLTKTESAPQLQKTGPSVQSHPRATPPPKPSHLPSS